MPMARRDAQSLAAVRRTLFEDRSGGRVIRGWIAGDAMAAGVECQLVAGARAAASAQEIAALLESHGVAHGLDLPALESLAAALAAGQTSAAATVARGTPPEPGRDGILEFIVQPSSESARYQTQGRDGRIDYRETNLVENVLASQPVAIELAPRPGHPGRDVLGREAPPAEGRPAQFKVGEGAAFDESSRQVLARRDGRVAWQAGVVSVLETYHIRGAVDYSVGNIAFVGEVLIDGDVLDGFAVRAGKGLVVGGNVGACQLDSDGDLAVRGSVFGKGRSRLRAKGRLTARILNDCAAESAGALTVGREAVGSTLLTNGPLLAPEGTVVGGSASALGGVDVEALGSPLGIPTRVAVGADYALTQRQEDIERRVEEIDRSVKQVSGFLGPLLADRRRMSRLVGLRRAEFERLAGALRDLRAERLELAGRLEELADAVRRGAVRQINVRGRIHSGVLLEIGAVRHRVKDVIRGPVTVIEDRSTGALRTVEFRDLPPRPAAAQAEPG